MATQLADYLFYFIALAILVSQAFILRSTHRGMRFARQVDGGRPTVDRRGREWAYAVIPALALAALLWFSWKTMHPDAIQVRGITPGERIS